MVSCVARLKFLVNEFVDRASKLFSGFFRCRVFAVIAKFLQFFLRPRYRTACTTFSTWGMRRSVRWIMAELVSKCARLCNQAYSASNYMLPRVKTNLYVIRLCTRMENRYPWDKGSECIGLYSQTLANQSQTESVVYVFLRTCDLCYNRVFKQYGLSTIANGTQTSNAKLKCQKHLPFLTLNTRAIRRGKTEATTTKLRRMDRNSTRVWYMYSQPIVLVWIFQWNSSPNRYQTLQSMCPPNANHGGSAVFPLRTLEIAVASLDQRVSVKEAYVRGEWMMVMLRLVLASNSRTCRDAQNKNVNTS